MLHVPQLARPELLMVSLSSTFSGELVDPDSPVSLLKGGDQREHLERRARRQAGLGEIPAGRIGSAEAQAFTHPSSGRSETTAERISGICPSRWWRRHPRRPSAPAGRSSW